MISYNNAAPKAVNNVGQFGSTEGSIGAYKSAAEYAADAKYWALLSQTKYSSVEELLAEVERLYAQGRLLEEDIEQLKTDFETQQQELLGLIQSTSTAIDNTNAATELSKEATQQVLAQLDIISNMTVQTTLLPPGSMATGSYDNSTGVFSFGIPEGQPGRDGTDGTISDIGSVAIGVPVSDDYGFYVDKENGGLYRASLSDIANLVPTIRSISINGGEEQTGAVSFNSVSSFNSRIGDVVSEVGDYSVEQITGAAKSGANSDITSLSGLTTALSVSQGGTGASTPEASRTNLGLGSVSVEDIVPLIKGGTGATTPSAARTNLGLGLVSTESIVPITKGGTGSTSAENARLALVAAKSGANSDITSMTNSVTFTQPVSVADAVDATNAVNLGQISSDQGASLIGTLEGVPVQNTISNINTDIIQLKLKWAIENGYSDAGFTFTTGGTLTVNDRYKVVYDPVSKTWYSYAGALPVVVPAGTNPASGEFVDVSGYKTDRLTSVASLGIIGDGVTDWSAAIQYAIDTYGSLYFPEGTYICANIQLRSGVQLVAASWSTVLKLPDGATTRSINGSLPDSRGRYPANVISTVLNHNGGAYFDNGVRAMMLNNSFYIVDGAEVSGFTIDGNKAGNPVGDVGENASAMGAGVCVFLSRGVKVKNNRIINCRQDGVILGYTLCGGSDECDVSDNVFFGNQRTNIALITGQRNKITGNLGGPTTGGIDTYKGAAVDLEPNWADEVCANNILTDNIMLGQISLVGRHTAYMRNNKLHGNLWVGGAVVNPSTDTQGSLFDADTFIADTTQPTPGPWITKYGPFAPSSASIKTTPPVRFSNCTAIGFDTLLQNLTQGQHENLVVENSTIRVKTIGQVVRGYRVDIKNNDITMDGDATSGQSILWSNSLGDAVPHQGCNSFKGNSVRGVSQSRLLEVINNKSYTNSRKTVEIHDNVFDVTGHTTIGTVTGDFDFTKNTITDWKPIDVSGVVKPFSIRDNKLSASSLSDMFVNQAGYINDISVSGNELTNININLQRPSGVTVNSNEMVDCSISVLYSFTESGVGGNSFSFNRMKNRSKTLVPITATLEGSSTTEDFWFKDIYKGNVISGYASGISIAAELTSVSEVS